MKFPTIHLNGTSADSLLEGWEEAYLAINEAVRKLAEAAPNGRDYYVQEPGALPVAQEEHFARMRKLQEVAKELEALCENVSKQQSERTRR